MRIAFVGKGGSGKTTISSLFIKHLAQSGNPVLAIDADINQHLGTALGLRPDELRQVPELGAHMAWMKDYFRGSNPLISSAKDMLKTTPPGQGSRLINLRQPNEIIEKMARGVADAKFLAVGGFEETDLGVSCYHAKTGAVELLLNHLVDEKDEYIVVDMTAGADAFASGLFTRFDLTCVVVEPTLASVRVYEQYTSYAQDFDVRITAVGNKVRTQADKDFLQQHLGSNVLTLIPESLYVRGQEQGQHQPWESVEPETIAALQSMKATLDACEKNWQRYHEQSIYFHRKNAQDWGNAQAGKDLTTQIDPDFRYL